MTASVFKFPAEVEIWQHAAAEANWSDVLIVPVSPETKRPCFPGWQRRGARDIATLKGFWEKWPNAMIGVTTGAGSGVWCLDIDTRSNGHKSLAALEAKYGKLPKTATVRTAGGGKHLWFEWPPGLTIKNRASDIGQGLDVRGGTADGQNKGQAVIPPSVNATGGRYEWEEGTIGLSAAVPAPLWLLFLAAFNRRERARLADCGIHSDEDLTRLRLLPSQWQDYARELIRPKRNVEGLKHDLEPSEVDKLTRYVEKAIADECRLIREAPNGVQDHTLNNAGIKIHSVLFGAVDCGLDVASLEEWAFTEYCAACCAMVQHREDEWTVDHAEDKWRRTETAAQPRDLSHVLASADASYGFTPVAQRESAADNDDAVSNLRIEWPETNDKGKPQPNNTANVAALLSALKVELRHNEFTGTDEISKGRTWVELNDAAVNRLWAIGSQKGLTYNLSNFGTLVSVIAGYRPVHPVREYLESLTWDKVPRVDTWLIEYLRVEDTPLNRAFGRATLLGAVHRLLHPGCKVDEMLVLESAEGTGKSMVPSILGGQWFTDGLKLGFDSKQTIEATRGRWIIEVAELRGMSHREVEAIKAQLSCSTDRARLAYGRLPVSVPRQWVAIGTTNESQYLQSATGNRRFMPVAVGRVPLDALKRARDSLWAEAYALAKAGEQPGIPEELWGAAAQAQEERRVIDPVEDEITRLVDGKTGIVSKDALWQALDRGDQTRRNQRDMNTMTTTMRRLGWTTGRRRRNGSLVHTYHKLPSGAPEAWLVFQNGSLIPESEFRPFAVPAN